MRTEKKGILGQLSRDKSSTSISKMSLSKKKYTNPRVQKSGIQTDLFSSQNKNFSLDISKKKSPSQTKYNKSNEFPSLMTNRNMTELYGFEEALSMSDIPKNQKSLDFRSNLREEYNFDNFVSGKASEVARAAAIEVSSNPGDSYNPLFIYGGSGLGKTHLMHSIGNKILRDNPNKRVLYVTSERFVKDYVDAVRLRSGDEFQNFYRSVDTLLVDDIQFIAGKTGSQEEFFHTFNVLLENKKQIILSCDKYPKEIPKLENRLLSRFINGLTVTISTPDLETRSAILLHKSNQFGWKIGQDVSLFMAKHIQSNVRELEGALRRVLNYAQFNRKMISEYLVYECLKDIILTHERVIKISNIQSIVSDYYNIKVVDLLSKKRFREIVRPRQMAITLTKDLTNHSLLEIGRFFGGRDHTTILHAVRTIKRLAISNASIRNDYQNLSNKLTC